MLNFLGYMLFSSFEYMGLVFLMLSLFSCKIKYFKIEYIITVFSVTLISYFITMLNPQLVPLIIILYLIICLKFLFKEKIVKSVIVVLGGLASYIALQFLILQFAIHFEYLKVTDLGDPFTVKSYTMQTLSSIIAITISIYIRVINGGFGFSLRSKKKPYHIFLYATIISYVLSSFCLSSFTLSDRISLFYISGMMFIVTSIFIFFLSYRRDSVEFS